MSNVIPFGKYRGVDIETVHANDPQYLDWLLAQPDFARRYGPLAAAVRLLAAAEAPLTPAHNAIQARFLSLAFCNAFLDVVGHSQVVELPHFEVHNVDVLFPTIAVELKPVLGDDYPAVMRQVLHRQRVVSETMWRNSNGAPRHHPLPHYVGLLPVALLYGEFAASNLTEAQVREMMGCSDIIVCSLTEVLARMPVNRDLMQTIEQVLK